MACVEGKLISLNSFVVDIETIHAKSDADLQIVLTAVQCSNSKPTILIGEDTDLLVLLCHYTEADSYPVYLHHRPKLNKNDSWNIHELQSHLGKEICKNILFLHAILGCDSTSRIHGLGKGMVLKAHEKSAMFRNVASMFSLPFRDQKRGYSKVWGTCHCVLTKG